MPLHDIQKAMFSAVRNPLTANDDMGPTLKNGRSTKEIAETIIKPNDRLTSVERLEIYNRQYWFRLVDCLYDDFPGLKLILGNKKFYSLTKKYLDSNPSHSYTLRDLGASLLQFVDTNPQLVKPRLRAAREMIQFEWAQIVAFDTAGYSRFDPTKVAMDSQTLTLNLQPYITLLAINYAFDDLLLELKEGNARSSEAAVGEMTEHESNDAIALPKTEKYMWRYIAIKISSITSV